MNNKKIKLKQELIIKNFGFSVAKKYARLKFFSGLIFSGCAIASSVIHASDIEIYRQGNDAGEKTIMLMVDTSQTMGSPALDLLRDYPLCISSKIFGVVGALPAVDVRLTPQASGEIYCDVIFPKSVLDLLGTVDSVTGTGKNSLLGLKSSLDYMRASCSSFSDLPSSEPKPDSGRLKVNISLGEGYRCYSRLSRIKIAVQDVINGNSSKNIEALSENVVIGLSVFPAKNSSGINDQAGMIIVPAKALSDSGQKEALQTAINDLFPSDDPLGNILDSVIGVLNSLLDGLNIVGLLTNVLDLIAGLPAAVLSLLSNVETPTATAYAETGAYLLGYNTKGTGEKLSEFESPINTNYAYKCLIRSADNNCSQYEKEPCNGFLCTPQNKRYNLPSYSRYEEISTGLLGLNKIVRYYNFGDSIYSGFNYRGNSVSIYGDNYVNPENIRRQINSGDKTQCLGQGIFVLTGNIPKLGSSDILGVQRVMQKSLGKNSTNNISDFCNNSPASWSMKGTSTATWSCIANYSKALLDKNSSYKTNVEIKTAVAGVGKEFNYVRLEDDKVVGVGIDGSIVNTLLNTVKGLLKTALSVVSIVVDLKPLLNLVDILLPTSPVNESDIENLVNWGNEGKGGWYTEASHGSISQSILDFSQQLLEEKPNSFLGVATIPSDPLTPYQLDNNVYNSMFLPSNQQNWFGNLKKYSVLTEGKSNGEQVIRLKGSIDFKDQWNSNKEEKEDGSEVLQGGVADQLKKLREKNKDSTRKLLINRDCKKENNIYRFVENDALKEIRSDYLADVNSLRCQSNSTLKDNLGGYLINLIGYKVEPENIEAKDLKGSEPLWQLGMPLHSTPVKITQYAKFNNNGAIDRDDYIIFGSTQGLLHVVDADDGKEKFAFVPNEMLENAEQRKAFTSQRQGSYRNMPYGVDGAWTAYTEYVYGMNDGKIVATVGQIGSANNRIKGKQVLYGGLRMGGRGYYALNLADLESPKLKFHINPDQAVANSPLSFMGQSWSKPTIAYVNWKGQRKQVMFVGGGYDLGYESKDYNPSLSKGAGIYMFDADNGDLLWWTSANATTKNDGNKEHALKVATMQYSVVSRINVLDRNGDGLMDHLYFGDLGGQVWRIDLNPDMNASSGSFAQYATRLLNLHKADGSSPRFYDAPSFSIYGYEEPLAVLSIASGNRSLPVSDERSGEIYNLFDRDVTRTDLYSSTFTPLTKDIDLSSGNALRGIFTADEVRNKTIDQVKSLMPNGWVISFNPNASVGKDPDAAQGKKILDEMAVVNKNLYVSVYNPGEQPTCPVQVRGETKVHRYCLPFGICEQQLQSGQVNSFVAGKGIVPINIGVGITDPNSKLQSRGLIRNGANNDVGELPINKMRRQLVPLTWYENNE
ncbi:pilus assembly protein [Acinetobacter beijerinckii]|uniref:PilY1 beta-propeller domain-containing protein n=1 Tax=Acinetobacter beijerinckii ANC 3835 TaxID=1217649 RepID=N9FEV9_9GAMM|nr:PilC/PilY family type IV pilus protein [Acinetobacter beijerinckii]ENW05835.1 hypothetical protein F934_00685 [Acinetobacter beijerinckii ANC 3835]